MKDSIKFSTHINCRDSHGKLFAVIPHPTVPYCIGNVVQIQRKSYIVNGMCMVNKRLNINFEEVKTANDSK